MPKLRETTLPSYRRHRASGQACVTLNHATFYLGRYGSAQSRNEYDRRITEWISNGRQLPQADDSLSVAEMYLRFRNHARTDYGQHSRTPANIDEAMREVLSLYGLTHANDFKAIALKAVRQRWIKAGRVRTNINRLCNLVKQVFGWAASEQLIDASVKASLDTVEALKRGRCDAIEPEPVRPVPIEQVEQVVPYLNAQTAALVRLQLLTGARPGELVIMRTCDIDQSKEVWEYRPLRHKTMGKGHERIVYIGPRAQEFVKPFLKPLNRMAFIFSPREAEQARRDALREQRKTPQSCGNRPGTNKKERPRRKPGECYTTASYLAAVYRACDRAFPVPKELTEKAEIADWRRNHHFGIHRLRHTAATELRKQFGLEGAQVILGHRTLSATQIYAEKDGARAREILAQVG